jgi:hypothetical protein
MAMGELKKMTYNDSPALKSQSDGYPASWYGKVPKRVKMAKTVTSDLPFGPRHRAEIGKEYDCWVNSHGAVAAILISGDRSDLLGVKLYEFEVIEWHDKEKM